MLDARGYLCTSGLNIDLSAGCEEFQKNLSIPKRTQNYQRTQTPNHTRYNPKPAFIDHLLQRYKDPYDYNSSRQT